MSAPHRCSEDTAAELAGSRSRPLSAYRYAEGEAMERASAATEMRGQAESAAKRTAGACHDALASGGAIGESVAAADRRFREAAEALDRDHYLPAAARLSEVAEQLRDHANRLQVQEARLLGYENPSHGFEARIKEARESLKGARHAVRSSCGRARHLRKLMWQTAAELNALVEE